MTPGQHAKMLHIAEIPELRRIESTRRRVAVARDDQQNTAVLHDPKRLSQNLQRGRKMLEYIHHDKDVEGSSAAFQRIRGQHFQSFGCGRAGSLGVDFKAVAVIVANQRRKQPTRTTTKVQYGCSERKPAKIRVNGTLGGIETRNLPFPKIHQGVVIGKLLGLQGGRAVKQSTNGTFADGVFGLAERETIHNTIDTLR